MLRRADGDRFMFASDSGYINACASGTGQKYFIVIENDDVDDDDDNTLLFLVVVVVMPGARTGFFSLSVGAPAKQPLTVNENSERTRRTIFLYCHCLGCYK